MKRGKSYIYNCEQWICARVELWIMKSSYLQNTEEFLSCGVFQQKKNSMSPVLIIIMFRPCGSTPNRSIISPTINQLN